MSWPVPQRTLALSVRAATWRRQALEAGDETGVPPSPAAWGLPEDGQQGKVGTAAASGVGR